MSYNVELTRRAVSDVDGILGWLGERSPQGAAAWHDVWRDVLDRLGDQPTIYGAAPEDADHDADIRHVVFKTRRGRRYRALFTIQGRTVFVLHVRGPGQPTIRKSQFEFPDWN